MTPQQLVDHVRREIIDDNLAIYRSTYANVDVAKNPQFERARQLVVSLPPVQQDIMFEMMRQVAVDTASCLFALIDGISTQSELTLSCDGQKLNGDLADLFLGDVEDAS